MFLDCDNGTPESANSSTCSPAEGFGVYPCRVIEPYITT